MLEEEKLAEIEEVLRAENVAVAYLFGSYAEGNENEDSDIDIGIVVEDPEEFDLNKVLELQGDLSRKLEDKVDIRLLNERENRFVYNVLRTGELIYSEDEELRADFEYREMKKYFDMKPFYDEYDRFVRQRVTA